MIPNLAGEVAVPLYSRPSAAHVRRLSQGRLDVKDRSSIECFEATYQNPQAVNREDLDAVEADRVGRARTDDTEHSSARLVSRRRGKHVAAGAVKPADKDDVLADARTAEALCRARFKYQPR
jgi:hypothetical protein